EIVRDHHDRGVELLAQAIDELEDLRLDGDVERGRRLVGDQQLRVVDERHRDHHALAHTARELVGIGVDAPARLGNADLTEDLDRAVERLRLGHVAVRADGLHQLVADPVERVQRRQRVLEDHRDVVAAQRAHLGLGRRQEVLAVEQDLARDPRVLRARQPHHGERRDRLARARLAHDAEHLAGLDRVGDAVQRLDDTVLGLEVDAEVLDLEQGHQYRTLGSRKAYRMSTSRFMNTTANARNRVVPWIVARSPRWIASYARRPTPGIPNTDSVRIAPPTRMPRSRPSTVTTGVIAARRPWRITTRRSVRPFARAVRT